MKRFCSMGLMLALSLAITVSGCGGGGSSTGGNNSNPSPVPSPTIIPNAGAEWECKVGTTNSAKRFKMRYVPAVSSFPTGTNDAGTGSVGAGFYMAETEVTYELWSKVYEWATTGQDGQNNPSTAPGAGKYKFANAGNQGNSIYNPVTRVNWRDVMVWCNALTEYFNATNNTTYECVYTCNSTILRDATNTNYCDAVVTGTNAKGFRLPTSVEWELAARYIRDINGDGVLSSGEYYPGSFASGADAAYNAITADKDVDDSGYKRITADVAIFNTVTVEYDSDDYSWLVNSRQAKAQVGTLQPNCLKIYDLSGNVWEWCFDISGTSRILRGGAWDAYERIDGRYRRAEELKYLQIGYVNSVVVTTCTDTVGFRPVRTL